MRFNRLLGALLALFILVGCAPPPPVSITPTPAVTATSSPTPASPTPTVVPPLPVEEEVKLPSPTPGESTQIAHVVIISVDGLRPDALEAAETPVLDRLSAAGAYSPAAQTVLPSVTLVAHASMLSGMAPDKHGIYWNDYQPELGLVNGPTLFSVAHDAGLSTAMVVGKPKLEHLVLPNSVDQYLYAGFLDRQVADAALSLLQGGLPAILFIHLPDVDSAGHATGWLSSGQLLAVSRADGVIGEMVDALEAGGYLSRTLLIITADHGGMERRHGGDSPEELLIPWLAVGPGVPAGLALQSEITIYDTAATALYALDLPIPPTWDGRPVLEIFPEAPFP